MELFLDQHSKLNIPLLGHKYDISVKLYLKVLLLYKAAFSGISLVFLLMQDGVKEIDGLKRQLNKFIRDHSLRSGEDKENTDDSTMSLQDLETASSRKKRQSVSSSDDSTPYKSVLQLNFMFLSQIEYILREMSFPLN